MTSFTSQQASEAAVICFHRSNKTTDSISTICNGKRHTQYLLILAFFFDVQQHNVLADLPALLFSFSGHRTREDVC